MSLPTNCRAVVTGAAGGLGRAFCRELVRRGGRVVASDIDFEAVSVLARDIGGERIYPMACDVAQLGDVERLAEEAERHLGGVDLVINNAGVAVGGRVGEIPIEDWRWIVEINLYGVIHGCHVFTPLFRRQRSGHILNVASAAGLISSPNLAPYNATKAAVVAMSEAMRGELASEGIGVTVLCPTFFQTNIASSARIQGELRLRQMVGNLMAAAKVQADDVARLALDGVGRGELYVLPHRDGRVLWLFKRLLPRSFYKVVPKLLERRVAGAAKAAASPAG